MIMDKLPGPMFSSEDFPEGDQQRAARGAEAAFDFTPYLDAGGSPKRPREDEGALEGTLEDALAAVLAKKAKAIAKASQAGSAGAGRVRADLARGTRRAGGGAFGRKLPCQAVVALRLRGYIVVSTRRALGARRRRLG